MTSTAYDDQFAVCTPEEDALFEEMQARKDEALISEQRAQRDKEAATEALEIEIDNIVGGFSEKTLIAISGATYDAIKAGRIPGVVLGGGV